MSQHELWVLFLVHIFNMVYPGLNLLGNTRCSRAHLSSKGFISQRPQSLHFIFTQVVLEEVLELYTSEFKKKILSPNNPTEAQSVRQAVNFQELSYVSSRHGHQSAQHPIATKYPAMTNLSQCFSLVIDTKGRSQLKK